MGILEAVGCILCDVGSWTRWMLLGQIHPGSSYETGGSVSRQSLGILEQLSNSPALLVTGPEEMSEKYSPTLMLPAMIITTQ